LKGIRPKYFIVVFVSGRIEKFGRNLKEIRPKYFIVVFVSGRIRKLLQEYVNIWREGSSIY
jgi:hypothetical protein